MRKVRFSLSAPPNNNYKFLRIMSCRPFKPAPRCACALSLVCIVTLFGLGGLQAQSNDNFALPTILSGTLPITSATVSNITATVEEGELDHYFDSIATRSLWWAWTPAADVRAEVSAAGHDTVMAIYKGTALNALTLIGNNDDGDSGKGSRVRFMAKAGQTYVIAVDGLRDQTKNLSGDVTVNVKELTSIPPVNDNWQSAFELTGGLPRFSNTDNTNATVEDGEPVHLNTNSHTSSIWWRWTAPTTESVRVTADDLSIDTIMAVYSGPTNPAGANFSALSLIDSNDDGELSTAAVVEFKAQAGLTYYFAVDGSIIERGDVDFYLEAGQAAPGNDNFSNAITIAPSTSVVVGRNSGATAQVDEPDHSGDNIVGNPTSSAWWKWQPVGATAVEINTFNSLFDTILSIYSGSAVDDLTLVARSDNAGGTQSRVRFNADGSTLYYIAVDGKNSAEGPIVLSVIQPGPAKPENDDFEDAVNLGQDLSANDIGSNIGGTVQSGEPSPTAEASVWYSWTAPATAKVEVNTFGSDFNTSLGIYAGGTMEGLTMIAFNNNSGGAQSRLVFPATVGTKYYVVVGGSRGAEGVIDINLQMLGAYASWVLGYPSLTGADKNPHADKDGDGFTNIEEMAYHLNPTLFSGPGGTDPNSNNSPSYSISDTAMSYTYVINPAFINVVVNNGDPIVIKGQSGSVLSGWTTFTPNLLSGNIYQIQVPISALSPHGFCRLQIVDPN